MIIYYRNYCNLPRSKHGTGNRHTSAGQRGAPTPFAATGEEPSIIAVQERIGGGSYSTVKRFLAAWKAQQEASKQPAVDLPDAVAARGAALVRELWGAAAALAEQRSTQVREEAQRQVEVFRRPRWPAPRRRSPAWRPRPRSRPSGWPALRATIAGLRDELAQAHAAAQVAEARIAEQARQIEDLQQQAQRRDDELAQARMPPPWSRPGSPARSLRCSDSSGSRAL